LRPAFIENGSTTAAQSSQMSDGAAAVLLTRRDVAERLGLKVMGVFRGYSAVGVAPAVMGVREKRERERKKEKEKEKECAVLSNHLSSFFLFCFPCYRLVPVSPFLPFFVNVNLRLMTLTCSN
jgi:hypothetical protein